MMNFKSMHRWNPICKGFILSHFGWVCCVGQHRGMIHTIVRKSLVKYCKNDTQMTNDTLGVKGLRWRGLFILAVKVIVGFAPATKIPPRSGHSTMSLVRWKAAPSRINIAGARVVTANLLAENSFWWPSQRTRALNHALRESRRIGTRIKAHPAGKRFFWWR